ncbi:conserved Plasmodium membrane protein, unknown function [Plasmodium ovale curtisi]|uniref:Uncharacterized protein n=1 Tax=Plasmodium ovale curtisi TaxID=864141 RepID=A0A1A8VY74_PLAOA|nr:conserved Plasmodium membrane protein, unknown function [Plasmodium ovale curtisi]
MLVGNKRETMGIGLSRLHRRSKKGKDGISENCDAKYSISKQSIVWHSIEQHSKVRNIFLSVVDKGNFSAKEIVLFQKMTKNDEVKKGMEPIDDAFFCKTIKTELQVQDVLILSLLIKMPMEDLLHSVECSPVLYLPQSDEYKKKVKHNFLLEHLCKTEVLIIFVFLAPLLAGILLLKDNDIISINYLTSLFVLITLLLLLFIILYSEIDKAQNSEFLRKIEEAKKILSSRNFSKSKKEDTHFNYLTNSNFIFIQRNKKWELLPTNLLIKQDIFLLHAGDLIPCRCIEYNISEKVYGRKYEKHEVFMPMDKYRISTNLLTKYPKDEKRDYLPSFHFYSFVSYENVSISTIKKYINVKEDKYQNSRGKDNLRNVILTEKIHLFYIYICLLDLRKDVPIPQFVFIYLLIYSVLMSITVLPFFHRMFSELIYGYCSSLNMIYENYFKDGTSFERGNFSFSFDFSSTTEDSSYETRKKFGLLYTLKNIFLLIFKGIKINKCYLNILSDCSVLCFLDSSGILVNTNHSIKEICIYNYLNGKKDVSVNNNMKGIHSNYNYILTIIDIFMDNKSMYAYQRIKNIKILHSLFLISYYTQIPKYIKMLDNFQMNLLNYMNQQDYSHLYICLCDIGNISYPYNKFGFYMLFFCVENKSDYELYKRKNAELKRKRKSIVLNGDIPYHVSGTEDNSLGINIYDTLTSRDNFVFIFVLYERKKDKYHMFLKGHLDALVSKCMFYYDGKIIKKLKRREKKVLRILNIQWISSGIESICFAYRPLSTDEMNYLKNNFTKNIYILTINKRKVYSIKNFYNEKSFTSKENEKFLSHLLSTSIFIGNSAVKILTSNEVQTRINDFYDAGIRFVHFSKANQIRTRSVANLLGMETNWNTSISLSLNDKLRNQFNTAEMIKILLENNEIITCVGNSLNCCNFEIFNLCSYSISVLLPFNNICKDCHGKKERSNPFEDLSTSKNPLISYSSFVNSFPCNLIIEKDCLGKCSDKTEDRTCVTKYNGISVQTTEEFENIQEECSRKSVNAVLLYASVADYLLFILFVIPLLSISLLNNNNNSTIMNDIPDKVITKEFLIKKLLFFLIKWIPLLVFSLTLVIYYLHLINKEFASKHVINSQIDVQRLSKLPQDFLQDLVHHCSKNVHLMTSRQKGGDNGNKSCEEAFKMNIIFATPHADRFSPTGRIYVLPPYYVKRYPDITLTVLIVIFSIVILTINETLKKVEEKIKINRQKYLKVLCNITKRVMRLRKERPLAVTIKGITCGCCSNNAFLKEPYGESTHFPFSHRVTPFKKEVFIHSSRLLRDNPFDR